MVWHIQQKNKKVMVSIQEIYELFFGKESALGLINNNYQFGRGEKKGKGLIEQSHYKLSYPIPFVMDSDKRVVVDYCFWTKLTCSMVAFAYTGSWDTYFVGYIPRNRESRYKTGIQSCAWMLQLEMNYHWYAVSNRRMRLRIKFWRYLCWDGLRYAGWRRIRSIVQNSFINIIP